MKLYIYDIVWELDEEDEGVNLPTELCFDVDGDVTIDDIDNFEVADYLSEEYGFLVNSFCYDIF